MAFAKETGLPQESLQFSDFTNAGFWGVDDVLRPIYPEAGEVLDRDFPYPEQ